jgi:hypothetical protein
MPLSREEQAVINHKFLTSLNKTIGKPIDLHEIVKQHTGHSHLVLHDTTTICTQIAERSWRRTNGARSLKSAVANIADKLAKVYSREDGLVDTAINDGPLIKFDFIPQTTRSGRIDFTVVRQPEARLEIEAEPEEVGC